MKYIKAYSHPAKQWHRGISVANLIINETDRNVSEKKNSVRNSLEFPITVRIKGMLSFSHQQQAHTYTAAGQGPNQFKVLICLDRYKLIMPGQF